jgi:hypothetical protein
MAGVPSYAQVQKFAQGLIDPEMGFMAVLFLALVGLFHMIVTSMGISIFKKCDAKKNEKTYIRNNEFQVVTLTLGLAIPFTLLINKFFKNDVPAFLAIFGILGLINSAMTLDLSKKCSNAKKSDETWAGISLAIFSLLVLVGGYGVTRKAKGAVNAYRASKIA